MHYKKTVIINTTILAGLLLTGCSSSSVTHANDYIYQGINFGPDRDAHFKKGVQDACKTADGDYTKDHNLFNNNISYRVGWEDGRLECKGQEEKDETKN
jgi:uncharacterized protein YcfL